MATGSQRPTVVVGVDGSEESVAALRWAAEYSASTGAAVSALMAWHFPTAAAVPPVGTAPTSVRNEVEEHIKATLSEAIGKAQAGAGGSIDAVIRYGHPAQVLIEESRSADLLVVGRKGRGGFVGMLLGSVSQHCVNAAECPVVVIRSRVAAEI
jgi:nucleotide-binding universal stress UspA family protein